MDEITCTLLSDGSSDQALKHMLRWLLEDLFPQQAIGIEWADLRRLPRPPRSLHEKLINAVEHYPCRVLFVHRDAEGESREKRVKEIEAAVASVQSQWQDAPIIVHTIPVRMLEAWLLIDEQAIRRAAGNPSGTTSILLPQSGSLEGQVDPKATLHECLRKASGRSGRRLKKFNVHQAVHRVAELIDDYSPLRALPAFREMEQEISEKVAPMS